MHRKRKKIERIATKMYEEAEKERETESEI